jgi:hypothetical protein
MVNPNTPALKARFSWLPEVNRAFSARFRGDLNSWGGAPGWFEIAPAALNTLAA